MYTLSKGFRERSWGVYASREDRAIADVFEGMPSLWLASDELSHSRQVQDQSEDWPEFPSNEGD